MAFFSYLKSKRSHLQCRPLVVGTFVGTRPLSPQIQRAKTSPIDLVEVRLDSFAGAYDKGPAATAFCQGLLKWIRKKSRKPILATFRSRREGGVLLPSRYRISNIEREKILMAVLPAVHMVDVEIREDPLVRRLTKTAHRRRVNVIHSVHQFSGLGSWKVIRRLAAKSNRRGGDVFKVAVTPKSDKEAMTFLRLGLALPNKRKILIGMGKFGFMSRLVGFSFGSILTYGHLGGSAAPGQIPVSALVRSIRSIYPSF